MLLFQELEKILASKLSWTLIWRMGHELSPSMRPWLNPLGRGTN